MEIYVKQEQKFVWPILFNLGKTKYDDVDDLLVEKVTTLDWLRKCKYQS